jgi:hypothetical protein
MSVSASFIFCDDIRIENNGKLIFVGVYPEDLVPGVLPQRLALSVWARLFGVPVGQHGLHFAVGVNGKIQMEADFSLVVNEGNLAAHITLVGLPLELTDFGHIALEVTGFPDDEAIRAELPVVPPRLPTIQTAPAA